MRMHVFDDAEIVAQRVSDFIADSIRSALAARGRACLALSGGHTPWRMIATLATKDVPWRRVHVFQTDERIVSQGDPARTFPHIREALSCAPLPPDHLHPMPVDEGDLAAAIRAYASVLESLAGAPPILDLVHLGLGGDGHTASLVPNDPALELTAVDVGISGPYRGHRRMTLTYPMINRARVILWLVTGADKAPALKRLYQGDLEIPAGRVARDRAAIFADSAAADRIGNDISVCNDETTA
jgi:6-phosphogluconolactonase